MTTPEDSDDRLRAIREVRKEIDEARLAIASGQSRLTAASSRLKDLLFEVKAPPHLAVPDIARDETVETDPSYPRRRLSLGIAPRTVALHRAARLHQDRSREGTPDAQDASDSA
jgi:hypothetical protein